MLKNQLLCRLTIPTCDHDLNKLETKLPEDASTRFNFSGRIILENNF